MTNRELRQVMRAALTLEKWAEVIRDSSLVRYIRHPRFGQFDDDVGGRMDERGYYAMMQDAAALRELYKRERASAAAAKRFAALSQEE